ncbi:uncharacterized protein LOC110166831 [Boleophthalmus pectinirostris]|uniref:uncharacterized protein LOC110166831 n=1 Tax=Boleophthalmus pectinirostris TaxID=150288 RepID=UPI00242D3178|nr:uncharacterized protein LOC110166831 [Boleophthalmus pectinirostris]
MEEGNEPPTQGNYNKMDNKTEHSSSNRPFYQPSFDEITTTTTPKLSKSDFTKAIKHGDKKETYTPPKNNPNEKASNPVSSSVNTQLSKTKIQLTMVAITEASTSSTPTSSNSHLGRDIKPQQQLPDYKDRIQSNQVDNTHLNHDVQLDKMKAKNEQYVSISTPTTSKFEHSIFNGQLSQSNYNERDSENKHSSLGAPLVKATSKPITVNDSIASNSEMTTSIEKGRKESNEDISSASSISTDLEKEPSGFDVSAKVNIVQPIANKLAEDTTISTPTAFKPHFDQNSNQGQQETKQKTNYGQLSTNYNEKDINSIQDAHMDTPTSQPASVLVDDISNSTLRRDASFKDLTSTTFTPHHISPTTTAPLQKDNRKDNRKISSSKIVPNQRPKPSIGMKPEANLKLKNPKNDRKPDHTPSPDTQVKNDQRRMHSKVTPGRAPWPAQTPSKSDQSTLLQVNVKNNPLPSATPIQKASTPTLAPSMAGVLTDDRKRPNVTSLHDSRQTMHSEIDKVSRMKQFIKKTGNMKNNTSKVMLAQNKSSEVNGTKEGSKTSPALNLKIPQINQKPKPQVPIVKSANPKLESSRKVKVEQALKDKIPKINTFVDLKNSSKVSPGLKPPNKPVKPKVIPASKIKPQLKEKEKNAKMDVKPTSGPIKLTTLNWETARDLAVDPLHQNTTTLESLTMNPNRGVISSSQTTEPIPSIALTTEPNIATQVSTTLPTKSDFNVGENSPSFPPRVQQLSPTVRAVFRSTAPPAPHPGPKATAVENTTPSARELRVKINQVAAFLNKSSQQQPHSRPLDEGPGDHTEVGEKTDEKPDMMVARDCSDHVLRGHTKSGLYLVTPDPSGGSVHVLCDMEESGGGWTVLQRRHDGSVSFNRSWAEYRDGFGLLNGGEFWLGNNLIHLLTRDRSMELRVELEDFEGVREYALYQLFKVASERMRYRLTVDGYSGTAGDALRFNTKYNHNSRAFTTPDRDNDRYPSGNCGTYYSSGWWFDACMAANLNGRYYKGRYKGVRDGIYWGTWHNISTEYYPTNERLSFKTVRMMIRPKGFKP